MAFFEGLPTYVGGYNEDNGDFSNVVYQYHWNVDQWIKHPKLSLQGPILRIYISAENILGKFLAPNFGQNYIQQAGDINLSGFYGQ
jgi:hypothetical protein